jgi:hypothetical protein
MADEVQLEEQWVKEKAAKQDAARRPPEPKSRKGLVIAIVGVLVAAAMVVVVILAGDESKNEQSDSAELISIQVRASPAAEIRIDGKKVGKTPLMLKYRKSDKVVDLEATIVRNLVGGRGVKKVETYQAVRRVTLDRTQVFDFTYANTSRVNVEIIRPDETGSATGRKFER